MPQARAGQGAPTAALFSAHFCLGVSAGEAVSRSRQTPLPAPAAACQVPPPAWLLTRAAGWAGAGSLRPPPEQLGGCPHALPPVPASRGPPSGLCSPRALGTRRDRDTLPPLSAGGQLWRNQTGARREQGLRAWGPGHLPRSAWGCARDTTTIGGHKSLQKGHQHHWVGLLDMRSWLSQTSSDPGAGAGQPQGGPRVPPAPLQPRPEQALHWSPRPLAGGGGGVTPIPPPREPPGLVPGAPTCRLLPGLAFRTELHNLKFTIVPSSPVAS